MLSLIFSNLPFFLIEHIQLKQTAVIINRKINETNAPVIIRTWSISRIKKNIKYCNSYFVRSVFFLIKFFCIITVCSFIINNRISLTMNLTQVLNKLSEYNETFIQRYKYSFVGVYLSNINQIESYEEYICNFLFFFLRHFIFIFTATRVTYTSLSRHI